MIMETPRCSVQFIYIWREPFPPCFPPVDCIVINIMESRRTAIKDCERTQVDSSGLWCMVCHCSQLYFSDVKRHGMFRSVYCSNNGSKPGAQFSKDHKIYHKIVLTLS